MGAITFAALTIAVGWAVRIPALAARQQWGRAGLLLIASAGLLVLPLYFVVRDLLAPD